jgi:glyoxylase-like metal-dependent hydrolase (beta-lactamase superfamily II)
VLADGDEIRAGGRLLRVVHRPGHSTTDTLVDEAANEAIVGDHLLANITRCRGDAVGPTRRRAARLDYLTGLKLTAAMSSDGATPATARSSATRRS